MSFPFRPSLTRRLLLALFAAFGLVGLVLVAWDYWTFQHQAKTQTAQLLQDFGQILGRRLESIPHPDQARVALDTLVGVHGDVLAREGRQEYVLHVWLWDAAGTPLTQPAQVRLPHGLATGRLEIRPIQGLPYLFHCSVGPTWRLCVAQQELRYLSFFRLWDNFLLPMLIAFPFVLLPVLWAIHRGLAPLHALARHVEARRPEDLAPVSVVAPQAELRPIIAAIDRLLTRMRECLEQEKAFVHDAAHELQTPLAGILVQAGVLARSPEGPQRDEALAHLEHIVGRVSHLIRQLLQFDRLEGGDPGDLETLDIARLVRDALARQGVKAEARGIDLSLVAPDHLAWSTRTQALVSLLDNLVDNALAYIPAGGRVEVGLSLVDDELLIRVADDGPGIPPQDRERVFRRFHRGRGQQREGTGLGLAIARQAAQALGGSLTLGSGLDGRGCGFTARLPRHR